jgi:hypothetical protein
LKVGQDGFEPPKSKTTDLQSVPFGHSGIAPQRTIFRSILSVFGAGGGIRTPDQLITNQLLWPTELHRQKPLNFFKNTLLPKKGLQIYKTLVG